MLLWNHYHVSDGRDYDYLGLFFYPISELLDYVAAFLFFAGFSEDNMRDFILMYQVYQGIRTSLERTTVSWAPYAMAFSYRYPGLLPL